MNDEQKEVLKAILRMVEDMTRCQGLDEMTGDESMEGKEGVLRELLDLHKAYEK